MRLAQRTLPAAAGAYFEQLVLAWETEVYAGRSADASTLDALCTQFDAHFAARAPAGTAPQPAGVGA